MQGGEGWNKNKTIEIYYLTNLSDAVMGAVPGLLIISMVWVTLVL